MDDAFVLILVGLTSTGAYAVGARWLGLSAKALRGAAGKVLECLGLVVVFFAVNLAAGMIAVFAARAVTRGFVSLYLADDVLLLVLSLLQGLLFAWWRVGPGAH